VTEEQRPVESMSLEEVYAAIYAHHIAEAVVGDRPDLHSQVLFLDIFDAARRVLTVAFSSDDPARALAEIEQLEESMKE
jgi:hypothetical protein